MAASQATVKVAFVGDAGVGKTTLQAALVCGTFPEYLASRFEVYTAEVSVDGRRAELSLLVSPGDDQFKRIRRLAYDGVDVFALCFSVDNPASFARVTEAWIPELLAERPHVPVVLLGLRADLRDHQATVQRLASDGEQPLTVEDGKRLCAEVKAQGYLDISALTGAGTKQVLNYLARVGLDARGHRGRDQAANMCCTSM